MEEERFATHRWSWVSFGYREDLMPFGEVTEGEKAFLFLMMKSRIWRDPQSGGRLNRNFSQWKL